jgi:gas vesicle protein GvpL/GvpF
VRTRHGMPTYLYCLLVADAAEETPLAEVKGVLGLGGAPIRRLRVGYEPGIDAWVSTVEEAPSSGADETAARALAHNAVVDAAVATGRTPVPARFGQRFADDEDCTADIARRTPALLALLQRVAGCVEMGVLLAADRAAPTVPEAPDEARVPRSSEPQAGRRYLEALRVRAHNDDRARTQAESAIEHVSSVVRPLVREESHARSAQGSWSASHLVPREAVSRYRDAIRQLGHVGEFRLIVSGPRGPYSFVGESSADRIGHDSGKPNSGD